MRSWAPSLLLLLLASPALASDGVYEINQTCAVETGCFPGDTPGFPVSITEPGTSYRLTSRLVLPDVQLDGISITTHDVGIDLNGFAIIGAWCVDAGTECTPSDGGLGVRRVGQESRGISVRNGSIVGMGSVGVFLADQAEVENVRVRYNGETGIYVGDGSSVKDSEAYANGGSGIQAETGSTVIGNTAYSNGWNGITAGVGSTVSDNTTYVNGNDGIAASTASTVSNNTTFQNGADGIDGGNGCSILGNTVYGNGDVVDFANDDGIECGQGCLVRDNAVRENAGHGLNLGAESAYGANVISNNDAGTVVGGFNILLNVCDGPNKPQCP